MPGKGSNEVGSLFSISLLCFLFMLQYVLFTSPVGGLETSSVDTCNFSHLDVYVQWHSVRTALCRASCAQPGSYGSWSQYVFFTPWRAWMEYDDF